MYWIVFGIIKLISWLPFPLLYGLSDFFYLIVYHVVKYRKVIVRENLFYSFPDKDEKERLKIEKQFYHHFCDLWLETLKLVGMSEKSIKKRMLYIHYEEMIKHYDEGRSVMLHTSHYANWEWTSSFSLYLPKDKPVYQIYKRQSSKISDRIIYKIRGRFGAQNIEMKHLLREMIRMRNEGKLGMFGMLSDQTPPRNNIHYYTQFLNQRTAVITGTEQLARKFNYPVYYVRMRKMKRGYYTCEFIPISVNPKDTQPFEITEKYMRLLEEDILNEPSLWLWSHKRWKYTRNVK